MAHAEHEAGAHEHDHGHAPFDPTPVRTIPDDEPPTAGWLPLLGLGLLALGLLVLVTSRDDATGEVVTKEPAAAKPLAAAKPVARPTRPAAAKPTKRRPPIDSDTRRRMMDPKNSPIRKNRR